MALFQEFEKQGVKLFRYRGTLPIFILVAALALYGFEEYSNQKNSFLYCFGIPFGLSLIHI